MVRASSFPYPISEINEEYEDDSFQNDWNNKLKSQELIS